MSGHVEMMLGDIIVFRGEKYSLCMADDGPVLKKWRREPRAGEVWILRGSGELLLCAPRAGVAGQQFVTLRSGEFRDGHGSYFYAESAAVAYANPRKDGCTA